MTIAAHSDPIAPAIFGVTTILPATFFIASVLVLGKHIINLLIRLLRRLDEMEAQIFVSFIFVMTLAWIANLVGLATIVGAFAAGLLLMDSQFRPWGHPDNHRFLIKDLFAPLEAIPVPIFVCPHGHPGKAGKFPGSAGTGPGRPHHRCRHPGETHRRLGAGATATVWQSVSA